MLINQHKGVTNEISPMVIHDQCNYCSKSLKYETEKITQTSERGMEGFYHNDCYKKAKENKINALPDL